MTYYKYAERSADSMLNWAEIGRNITDTLSEEARLREEKKAAIDEASRQFGEVLENAPQGEHSLYNQRTLELADAAQKTRLMQDRLLKSGKLNLKDYMVARQNMNDDVKTTFTLMKEYQAEYSAKMERMKKEQNQQLEVDMMAQVEGLANLNEAQFYLDPVTSRITVGKMITGPDGVKMLDPDVNNYASVNSLRNRITAKYDRYNVDAGIDGFVSKLGKEVQALKVVGSETKTGSIKEITDITKREGFGQYAGIVTMYETAENEAIKSELVNPLNVTSVLTENVGVDPKTGKAWRYTFDKEDAKKNSEAILLEYAPGGVPMPKPSADQESVATEFIRKQLRMRLDKEVTIKPVTEPQRQRYEWEYEAGKGKKEEGQMVGLWDELRYGTKAQKQSAVDAIIASPLAVEEGLIGIDLSDGKNIKFTYIKPERNRTIAIDPSMSAADWARRGTEVHRIVNASTILRASGARTDLPFNADFSGVKAFRRGKIEEEKPTIEQARERYNRTLSSTINPSVLELENEEAAPELDVLFGKYGFRFAEAGFNKMRVTPPNSAKPIIINTSRSSDAAEQEAKRLLNFMIANTPDENLFQIDKGGLLNGEGEPPVKEPPVSKEDQQKKAESLGVSQEVLNGWNGKGQAAPPTPTRKPKGK